MKSYEILERGLALIEDPKDWVRGARWKGRGYCAMGALLKTTLGNCSCEVVYSQDWDSPRFLPYGEAVIALARAMRVGRGPCGALSALGKSADGSDRLISMELEFTGPRCRAVEWFNDKHEHRAVVEAFQVAIRAEEARHGIHAALPAASEAQAQLVAYA